ncbi:MAG TPA: FHA domain-containing protein [bacterium]|nr:FHA domain-containing protein [bacterium]
MVDHNNHTRISSSKSAPGEEGRAVKASLSIESRMGRTVKGEAINLLFGNQMLIGRERSCDLFLDDDRISRKHSLLRIDPDAARLSDLGSTNGTTRNDEPVSEEIIIESGDLICFGHARTYEAKIVAREDAITSLRLASGADAYLLVPQEIIIGFADPKATDVDFRVYDPKILPRHARIEYFAGRAFIVTLDPSRPVVVNGNPVREIEIRNNYLIEIGGTLLRFERPD